MSLAQLYLPPDCEVYNAMYRTRSPEYLVQDQLSVELPNGFIIDVTWEPEHDPRGEYIVRVFYQYWNNQRIQPIFNADFDEVIAAVEELADRFSQPQVMTSSSAAQESKYTLEPA
jgi:hypothetical protein